MKLLIILTTLITSLFLSTGYQVGEKVENFSLVNSTDNQTVALNSYLKHKGVVIVFTSNYCPFSKLYEDRIITLNKEFEPKGIKFILINSNSQNGGDESLEEMAARAKEKGITFPYLADQQFRISDAFGATKTPEAFLLESKNGSFVLRYKGAIDDNAQAPSQAKNFFLKDAIQGILTNTPVKVIEKRTTGCVIKKHQ